MIKELSIQEVSSVHGGHESGLAGDLYDLGHAVGSGIRAAGSWVADAAQEAAYDIEDFLRVYGFH